MHMNSAAFYLRVCSINMIWEKIRNRNSRDKRKQEMQRKPTETQALAHRGENRHKLEANTTFLTVVRDFQGKNREWRGQEENCTECISKQRISLEQRGGFPETDMMMRTMATNRRRQTMQAGAAALLLREHIQATICYGMHFCGSHTTTEANSSLKFQILRSALQTQVMGEVTEVRKEEQEGKQRWDLEVSRTAEREGGE